MEKTQESKKELSTQDYLDAFKATNVGNPWYMFKFLDTDYYSLNALRGGILDLITNHDWRGFSIEERTTLYKALELIKHDKRHTQSDREQFAIFLINVLDKDKARFKKI